MGILNDHMVLLEDRVILSVVDSRVLEWDDA